MIVRYIASLAAIGLIGSLACASRPDPKLAAWGPYPLETMSAGSALRTVDILRLLRGGEVERAVDLLEEDLDRDIAGLVLPDDLDSNSRESYLNTLRYIANYRSDHPNHRPPAEVAELVDAAFQQLEASN